MLRNHNNGFYFIFNEHETDISIFKCTRQTRLEIPNQSSFFFNKVVFSHDRLAKRHVN